MLKHLSSRSESRDSIFETLSDLDESKVDELQISKNELSKSQSSLAAIPPSNENKSLEEKTITHRLTKPEIQRIILRRKSDLIKQELNKLDKSICEENKICEDEVFEESEGSFNSKEIIEEVQLENSTYLVHKRKRDKNSSLVSSTTDLSEKNKNEFDETKKEESQPQRDCWTSSDLLSTTQPLAASSPSSENCPSTRNSADNQNSEMSRSGSSIEFSHKNSTANRKVNTRTRPESRPSSLYLRTRSLNRADSHSSQRSVNDLYLRQYHTSVQNLPSPSTRRCVTLAPPSSNLISYKRALSTQTLMRKERFRQSKHSISASSSISNIPPNVVSRSCACSTIDGALNQINEEIEHENNLFIISTMAYKNRVQKCKCFTIFFVALAVICIIVGGFLHFYVGQFPTDVELNQGDMKFISVSSLFCSGVKATSDDSEIRLIAFNKNKEGKKHISYTRKTNFNLYPLRVWKRKFYLMADSEVAISLQINYLVDVLVFEGEKSFSLWSDRKQSETYIMRELCCSNMYQANGNFSFTAKRTDYYIIIIYNLFEVIPVDIHMLQLQFKRVSYAFSHYSSSCDARSGETCLVEYSFNTNDSVAIEAPLQHNRDKISNASTFRYECRARVWFYCLFFVGIFVVAFVVILMCYYQTVRVCIPSERCCCYKEDKRKGNFDIVYYDNLCHTGSQVNLTNLDAVSYTRSIAASRRSDHGLIFGDNISQRSRPHYHTSRASSYGSRGYREMGITNDAAAIYREELGYVSGISVNPDMIQSQNAKSYYNSAIGHQKARGRDMTVIDGPSLLNKPNENRSHGRNTKQQSINNLNEIPLQHSHSLAKRDDRTKKNIEYDNTEIFI